MRRHRSKITGPAELAGWWTDVRRRAKARILEGLRLARWADGADRSPATGSGRHPVTWSVKLDCRFNGQTASAAYKGTSGTLPHRYASFHDLGPVGNHPRLQLDRCLDRQAASGVFTLGMWHWGAPHPHSARTGTLCPLRSARALPGVLCGLVGISPGFRTDRAVGQSPIL